MAVWGEIAEAQDFDPLEAGDINEEKPSLKSTLLSKVLDGMKIQYNTEAKACILDESHGTYVNNLESWIETNEGSFANTKLYKIFG